MTRSRKRKHHRASRTTDSDVHTASAPSGDGRQAEEAASPSVSFGALLLKARQDRGIALDDVARETRVPKRYLTALENESIGNLPGGVYNRAYLRTYAAYVGLDADNVLRCYDRTVTEQTSSSPHEDDLATLHAVVQKKELQHGDRNAERGIFQGRVVWSMALLVLAGGAWVGARHLTYPARSRPPIPVATAALVTAPVPVSASMLNAQSELRTPQTEAESLVVPAAPVLTIPEEKADAPNLEDRQVSASMSVHDSGVGTDVVDRQLIGRSETFAAATRVVFWTLVSGGRAGDTIRHVWFHEGRTVAAVNLRVGSASWRTQSQRMLSPGAEGEWVVEAQDAHGRVLARHAFRCEA